MSGGPALRLASRAVKRRPLGLNDAYDAATGTRGAKLALATVNAVVVLVTALPIQSIAIRAVAERRPLMANGFPQDIEGGLADGRPLGPGKFVAALLGMDTGSMQDFRGVEVADARYGTLIKQSHFDLSSTGGEPALQEIGRNSQRVGAKFLR